MMLCLLAAHDDGDQPVSIAAMWMSRRAWPLPVVLSHAAFILVGVSAGVGGVLLPAQIRDYDIDMATIGLTLFDEDHPHHTGEQMPTDGVIQ